MEDSRSRHNPGDAPVASGDNERRAGTIQGAAGAEQGHKDRHILHGQDDDDRWAWRRRIKADPRTRLIYRIVVGIVGVTLMVAALLTGWLPGPGGIPLFLVGLAVLASEFEWAHRLLQWAKRRFHDLKEWSDRQPVWVRWASGLGTLALVGLMAWGVLVLLSVPGWFPDVAADLLSRLPGVEAGP